VNSLISAYALEASLNFFAAAAFFFSYSYLAIFFSRFVI
jgi:hypothetical protein